MRRIAALVACIALASCSSGSSSPRPTPTVAPAPAQSDISFGCAISPTNNGPQVTYNAANDSSRPIQIGSMVVTYSSGYQTVKYPVATATQGADVFATPIVIKPGQAQTGTWFPTAQGAIESTSCSITQWTGQFVS